MHRYSRLYKDPKSPLTPLTPLSGVNAFNFDLGGDNSLRDAVNDIVFTPPQSNLLGRDLRPQPKRYSDDFLKIRGVFEQPSRPARTKHLNTTNRNKENIPPKDKLHPTPLASIENLQKNSDNHNIYLEVPTAGVIAQKRLNKQADCQRYQSRQRRSHPSTPVIQSSTPQRKHQQQSQPRTPLEQLSTPQQQQQQQHKPQHNMQQLKQKSSIQQQFFKFSKFLQVSPIARKPLSPRIASVLSKTGLSKYMGLFQKEEIDMDVFSLLTQKELEHLGVRNEDDRKRIFEAIEYSYAIYRRF